MKAHQRIIRVYLKSTQGSYIEFDLYRMIMNGDCLSYELMVKGRNEVKSIKLHSIIYYTDIAKIEQYNSIKNKSVEITIDQLYQMLFSRNLNLKYEYDGVISYF